MQYYVMNLKVGFNFIRIRRISCSKCSLYRSSIGRLDWLQEGQLILFLICFGCVIFYYHSDRWCVGRCCILLDC